MQKDRPIISSRDRLRLLVEKRIEAFLKGYRQNLGLIGTSGVGKTHFLRSVHQSLRAQPDLISVYIRSEVLHFHLFVDRWIGAVLTGFFLDRSIRPPSTMASLILAADPYIPKTTEKIRHLKKNLKREKSAALLKELFTLPEVLSAEIGKKVVLLLDEFQKLQDLPVADPFSLLGREITVGTNVLYIAASSASAQAREIFREKLTCLFGGFEVQQIPLFEFDETARYLDARFEGRCISESQKRFLIQMTNGNPAYLDLIIDQLEALLRGQTADEQCLMRTGGMIVPEALLLESFFREMVPETGRLAQLFQRRLESAPRLSKDTSAFVEALIAVSHGRRKLVSIASFMERKSQDAKKILQRLVQEDYLVRTGSFFMLEDPLFRFWLREVFDRRLHSCSPDENLLHEDFFEALKKEFVRAGQDDRTHFMIRIEALLREFRNDHFEIEAKKSICPQFSEIVVRETSRPLSVFFARNSKLRWILGAAPHLLHEGDVALFLDEVKRQRKKAQKKILIALGGIEQNAKLMAQEAGIQIWNLKTLNLLLDLYDLPKIIFFPQQEIHESALGALAQSLHTA